MKQVRVVAVILGAWVALLLLLGLDIDVPSSPQFGFLWHMLVGTALGLLVGVLLVLAGAQGQPPRYGTQLWISAVLLLILMAFQYGAAFGGVNIPYLNLIKTTRHQVLFGEGVLLGFICASAIRAKR